MAFAAQVSYVKPKPIVFFYGIHAFILSKRRRWSQNHSNKIPELFKCYISDPPHLDDITVTTGKDTITLQVNCIELLFPHFHDTRWEKNDEKIDLTKRKFSGRGTFLEYLTIRSPNEEDRGTYTCKFIGGLRTLSRPVTLGKISKIAYSLKLFMCAKS